MDRPPHGGLARTGQPTPTWVVGEALAAARCKQIKIKFMASLSGPHPLSTQFQVKIPTKLARELHIQSGDEFFWRRSDDDPAVLLLIPAEVVERRYSAGERAEAAHRPHGAELDLPVVVRPDAEEGRSHRPRPIDE